MKKLLMFLMLAVFASTQVSAQMTDDQVVTYVKEQHQAGKSQQAIALDLQGKGVSKEQLLRIKAKYDKGQTGTATGSSSGSQAKASTKRKAQKQTREESEEESEDLLFPLDDEEDEDEEIRIFGHDLFNSKTLTFEPNMNIPTPANYTLGPGDELIVDIYGASQSNTKYEITPDGTIVVEKIGPIAVSGLTVDQAQSKVKERIGGHYQGSSIKVTVGQTRTVLVNVLGEVVHPGTYTLSAFSSVFNALYLAGGITEIGTLRNIKVARNGRIITTIDVYDFIINGKLTGNVMLKDNDAIIVGAYDALVSIDGAIKRPMYYEMKRGESLEALLKYAGGFLGDANRSVINVERKTAEGYTVHSVEQHNFGSFGMEDGDEIEINSIVKRYQNMVEVSGAVFYPGRFSLSNDCNSVRALISKAGGLTEHAFVNRAVLYRMKEDRTRKVMSVDLRGILASNSPDVILLNEDSLVVASTEEDLKRKQYFLYGPVMNEGLFQYAEGMTLEDAIIAAGGLKEEALLSNVEVARRLQYTGDRDTTYNRKAEIYTFDIEDGLVINEGKTFVIKPFDVITIKRNPEYADVGLVYVGGEVKYPGMYSLKSRTERLSDLIKRAGGITQGGFVEGAKLTRSMTPDEKERAQQLWEMTHTRDSVKSEMVQIKEIYPVGIDLVKAMKKPGSEDDVVLRGGDNLIIPQINNTVKINGEVLYPNTVAYVEGKSGSYYINQAGGVSEEGKKSKAYIIYANGQVSRLSKGRVMPGSEIVVPTKQKKNDNGQKSSLYLAGASTMATIGAILVNALK